MAAMEAVTERHAGWAGRAPARDWNLLCRRAVVRLERCNNTEIAMLNVDRRGGTENIETIPIYASTHL